VTTDFTPVLEEALAVALAALAGQSHAVVATKSSPSDPVTEADRTLERVITDTIHRLRPDDAVLGEEFGQSTTSPVRWIVDPIDGTVNYSYQIPAYAISIAVEVEGQVVQGVVHNPATGERFAARRGCGATCNGRPLASRSAVALAEALVGTGFSYHAPTRARQGRMLASLIGEVRDIRRFGAAALDLCFVAAGRLDAYYETGLKIWDVAAGALVAREAGLEIATDLPGIGDDRLCLCAPPGLFDALAARLHALLEESAD